MVSIWTYWMLIDRQMQPILQFSRPFDHHGKTKHELCLVISFEKLRNKPERPKRSLRKNDESDINYACEEACEKIANMKSAT